jgi:hypothetical protein
MTAMTKICASSTFVCDEQPAPGAGKSSSDYLALAVAKRSLQSLRSRRRRFPNIELGDANWEMMLDLFIATEEGRRISMTSLTMAVQVSNSTALRCIRRMVQDGQMHRTTDVADGRRSFVSLDPAVHAAIRAEMIRVTEEFAFSGSGAAPNT